MMSEQNLVIAAVAAIVIVSLFTPRGRTSPCL